MTAIAQRVAARWLKARGWTPRILSDLLRFVKEATAPRAWVVFAYTPERGPSTEYVLRALGRGEYNLGMHRRSRPLVINNTKDPSKLAKVLGDYDELDWEPAR